MITRKEARELAMASRKTDAADLVNTMGKIDDFIREAAGRGESSITVHVGHRNAVFVHMLLEMRNFNVKETNGAVTITWE